MTVGATRQYYAVDTVAWTPGSTAVYTDMSPPTDNTAAWYTSAAAGGAVSVSCGMFGVTGTYLSCRAVPVYSPGGALGGVAVAGMFARKAYGAQEPGQGTEPCAGTCGPNAEASRLAQTAAMNLMPVAPPPTTGSATAAVSVASRAVYMCVAPSAVVRVPACSITQCACLCEDIHIMSYAQGVDARPWV